MPRLASAPPTGAKELATLRDVARLAGVSPSTVSRILNGTARVTSEKQAAVQAAITRLGFKPNLSARSLRSGSTMTIGVLTQDLESPYFTAGLRGVDEGLQGSGYAPVIVPGHWNPSEEAERVSLLIARRVDAIAILGGRMSDAEVASFARQVPIAITDRTLSASNVMSFEFDQVEGGRMATEHLIALGHRRIAHISGPKLHADAVKRTEGFMRAHADAGLTVDPRLIVESDFLEAAGMAAMGRLLEAGVAFSAVFCANDQTLFGARLALLRRGLRVPDDVSLVGFDDLPISAYMTPPVTTVRQPQYEMGLAVASALLSALGIASARPAAHPPLSLVVRETTAAPKHTGSLNP
jgi:LacI family transcriptional regulator